MNRIAKERKALRSLAIAGTLILALALVLGTAGSSVSMAAPPNGRYFVGFRGAPDAALVRNLGGEIVYSYGIIPAVAARLPEAAVTALAGNPNVAYVEADGICHATADTLPWGVERVEADHVQAGGNYGTGIKVGIIDTGIDIHHTDLVVAGGVTFVLGTTTYDDDAGHGTHVAGTVAALINGIGVIGCAPEATLYAIKVLDSTGSGAWTDVVYGIDWAVANGMKIINMSLGGSSGTTALQAACDNAYAAGVLVVCAAGNSGNVDGTGDNVIYPAAYESCMAVAATDSANVRAYFSSTGPAVEIAAPGVSIYSTYYNGGYTTMSGTSMASPHVAGVAALVWKANPTFTNAQVRSALDSTAIDLGAVGRDPWYGYGLVNAVAAVGGGTPTPALTVTVSTDKATYTMGETVIITTQVKDQAGVAVSGATVNLTIKTAKLKTKTATGTTGTDGKFIYNYKPKTSDGKGTYTVTSAATKTGYTSGTGACSFVMQ
jgi:minor extracellular protease Epr